MAGRTEPAVKHRAYNVCGLPNPWHYHREIIMNNLTPTEYIMASLAGAIAFFVIVFGTLQGGY
jgi:hypothetical protein